MRAKRAWLSLSLFLWVGNIGRCCLLPQILSTVDINHVTVLSTSNKRIRCRVCTRAVAVGVRD